MTSQLLAVVIPLMVALSVELTGNNKKAGFMLGFLIQVCNGLYAVVTMHWGWLLGPLIAGPVFYRNYLKWKHRQGAKANDQHDSKISDPVV